MNNAWWAPIVQWTLWGIATALVMGWVAKGRNKARPASEVRRLVHPASTLIIGVIAFTFFAGIAVVSNVFANSTTTWWTTATFTGFALFSLVLIADYFFARHVVSEAGLSYGRFLGSRGYLRWTEVSQVKYAQGMKWFRLQTHSGSVVRVSAMLVGLPEFAKVLLAHTSPGAIDRETLAILEATASGNPPRVWG